MLVWSNGLADTMQSEKILEAWHLVNKGSARVIHTSRKPQTSKIFDLSAVSSNTDNIIHQLN